jgi:hypothetical protein
VPKFAIGLHTDFIAETFKVEKDLESGENEVLERSFPIAPALVVIYKPGEEKIVQLSAYSRESKYH